MSKRHETIKVCTSHGHIDFSFWFISAAFQSHRHISSFNSNLFTQIKSISFSFQEGFVCFNFEINFVLKLSTEKDFINDLILCFFFF